MDGGGGGGDLNGSPMARGRRGFCCRRVQIWI